MKLKFCEFLQTASGGWKPVAVAIALIFMLGFAATVVNAQDDATAAGFNSPLPGQGGRHGGGNPAGDLPDGIVDVDELLAHALGITVEDLETAKEEGTRISELIDVLGLDAETVRQEVQDTVETAVEQAVTDGSLTEDEAEAILNGPGGSDRRGGENSELKDLLDEIVDRDELLADALGITVEELEAAKEEGTRIDELIDALGLEADTVRQEVEDALKEAVEQAATDGELTEEEAEAILDRPSGQEGRPGPGGAEGRGPGGRNGPGRRDEGFAPFDDNASDDDSADDGSTDEGTAGASFNDEPAEQPIRGLGAGGPGGRR